MIPQPYIGAHQILLGWLVQLLIHLISLIIPNIHALECFGQVIKPHFRPFRLLLRDGEIEVRGTLVFSVDESQINLPVSATLGGRNLQ